MLGVSELYGGEQQVYQRLFNNFGFNIHVALPAVVQSYNSDAQTVEVQPTIRERVIQPDGQISYIEYPLLVNVPVAFPQASGYSITFPIAKGDECLVIFSDLSIDNWWLNGNVQNPVEQRRHDLSDGIAIFGIINQKKLSDQRRPASDELAIYNSENGVGLTIGQEDGTISAMIKRENLPKMLETYSFSEIILKLFPSV